MRAKPFLLVAFVLVPWPAAAQYTYTEIARAGSLGPGVDFVTINSTAVSVNNSGAVAFRATTFGFTNGVYSSSGGSITTIVESGGAFDSFADLPSINSGGDVAFWAATPGLTDFQIRRGSGGATTLIASRVALSFSTLGDQPSVNSSGTVAFYGGPPHGIYLGSGGPVTTLYSAGDPFVLDVSTEPTFNDSGQALFIGRSAAGVEGMFRGSGGALTGIAINSTWGGLFSGFPAGVGSMNLNGVAAFDAYIATGGEGIFTSTGVGLPITIANSFGPYDDFKGSPAVSLFGLAFTASLDVSGTVGIFTGPDPVTNRVIKAGDALLGSTVASIRDLGRFAINDSGEIAFVAGLANGDTVVVRATPGVVSPPTLRIFLSGTNSAVLAWVAPSFGFSLQQNTNLLTTNWTSVTNDIILVDTDNQVIISPPLGSRFYRLLKP